MDALSAIQLRRMPVCRPRQPLGVSLDIHITDRQGRTVLTRRIDSDLVLRNLLCAFKGLSCGTTLTAADTMTDVFGTVRTPISSLVPRQMLGSGTTAATSADYRIQTPLYTAPDAGAVGTVLPGAGNQVVMAITAAHTFASQTTVTEAGILNPSGSTTVYLTISNFQWTRDVFAGVPVPAGGTFTGTYTMTAN